MILPPSRLPQWSGSEQNLKLKIRNKSQNNINRTFVFTTFLIVFALFSFFGIAFFAFRTKSPDTISLPRYVESTETPRSQINLSIFPGSSESIKIGRLAFIKNGDIYHTDLRSTSLLVKNTTPAFDRLSWSPTGRFLAWRSNSPSGVVNNLIIYDRDTNLSFTINPLKDKIGELLDSAWSPDEKQIAVLTRDKNYRISLFPINVKAASALSILIDRGIAIKKIFWPIDSSVIFLGNDGIKSIEVANSQIITLVESKQVLDMKISPKKDEILYSIVNQEKVTLYLINIDGTANEIIPKAPKNIDMGKVDLPVETLENGFIPYAVFMPSGEKLLIGYKTNKPLPLVGVYDINKSSFNAVGFFDLRQNDIMINDYHLIGEREGISIFTLEDNSPLGLIWFLPKTKAPAFFLGINP